MQENPLFCPICTTPEVKQFISKGSIRVTTSSTDGMARGVEGYICDEGHIFFVRASDLLAVPAQVPQSIN